MTTNPVQQQRSIQIADVQLINGEIEAAVEVLRSGAIRQGKLTQEFEERFAEAVGARHAIAVSSGTAALHMAWLAMLEPGGEVLVPAFTFIASASSVVLAGGRPIFCDVLPESGLIDVEDARRRLTPGTRGIAPVHLYGNAANVTAIQELAKEHDLRIVWDAAQAHGTTYNGFDIGGLDEIVCYSFYPTKNMTTAEGGMITTNDDDLNEKLRLLRSHGQAKKYYHTAIGLNYRMTDVQAAIGLVQLEQLPGWLERRQANAEQLSSLLEDLPGISTPAVAPGIGHSYHQYTIQVDPDAAEMSRDQVSEGLKSHGVGSAVHYPRPLHQQPVFAEQFGEMSLPVSEQLSETVLSLPIHPNVSNDDLQHIARSLQSVLEGRQG